MPSPKSAASTTMHPGRNPGRKADRKPGVKPAAASPTSRRPRRTPDTKPAAASASSSASARPNRAAGHRTTGPADPGWTFLTNHSHVLVCLAEDPEARLRDIAERVGITERAVSNMLRDLEEAGIVGRTRDGRRNRYRIDGNHPLRHPLEAHRRVQDLLALLQDGVAAPSRRGA